MKLVITVDGKTYQVEVEASEPEAPHPTYLPPTSVRGAEAPPLVAPPPAATDGSSLPDDRVCRSPIGGTVIKVVAQPGQSLQAGDLLLVLEAMKMETQITAPRAGKVAALNVAMGDAVRAGQVLVELA